MGEVNGDFEINVVNDDDDGERVHEWELGLPNVDDITPLNQGLVPPELLSAFDIKPEPYMTIGDVSRASNDTISTIRGQSPSPNFKPFDEAINDEDEGIEEVDDDDGEGHESKKSRRNESPEDADSAAAAAEGEKMLKRPRLVWTPQLHKRFVDVVAHLGIKNAVPKTIMQLMNVEGLTRENVASHLQKYRLYLKRMQGVSFDSPANSSPAPAVSAPVTVPGSSSENGHVPMSYGGAPMVPVPMPMMMKGYNGFESNHHHHHHNHANNQFHHNHHQYNGMMQTGNKYGSVVSYHHQHPPHVGDR